MKNATKYLVVGRLGVLMTRRDISSLAVKGLNISGRGPPKKHQHQICNKSVHLFKRRSKWVKQRSLIQSVNIGKE